MKLQIMDDQMDKRCVRADVQWPSKINWEEKLKIENLETFLNII